MHAPSDTTNHGEGGTALARFLDLRTAVRAAPIGDGGPDTCDALTESLDAALAELAAVVTDEPVAVVALGGYGRGEQCLSSDIDVMLLHDDADIDTITRAVLYPLWDANLKVGHAVRTVKECAVAGADAFDTLTSLLSSRHVAGDESLAAHLEQVVVDLVRGRPLEQRLAEAERERRTADPYPVMAADLKNGRGGLRTFQGFWWQRRRASLLGLHDGGETADEYAARANLLAIRNALHATAGRAHDRFHPDLRDGAAAWLGIDALEAAGRLTRALGTGDRLASERWPDLLPGRDPLVRFGRRVFRRIRSRFADDPAPAASGASPPLAAALRAAARPEGVHLEPEERDTIRNAPPCPWGEGDRTALLRLLGASERGRAAFAALEDLGWTATALPEWNVVSSLPQLAPFHEHPVGAHLWRTVDEAAALGEDPDPLTVETVQSFGSDEELLLAAFLHDIGKGHGGDHSVIGEKLATTVLRRCGFGPATVAVVGHAVRHHLLLSRTAMRRDIADPAVIEEVADLVGDLRILELVYLLSIADARATGSTVWTPWKAALVRQLFAAVAAHLGDEPAPGPSDLADRVAATGRYDRRAAAEHIAAMPPTYAEVTTPEDVVWHLDAVAGHDGPVTIAASDDPRRVVVVGPDRRGFMLAVSRVFAANGVAVVDARLMTRDDGLAIDTFRVHRDVDDEPVDASRWDGIAADLRAVFDDGLDVRPRLRERVRTYATSGGEVTVRPLRAESTRHTVIEVRATDRVGLLADIVEALHSEGLDLHVARLDTRARQAVDVFHVRRLGVPIRVEPELQALCARVADRLRHATP